MKHTRSLALLLLASMASPVLAQPAPGTTGDGAATATTGTPPQDDPLYSCKKRTGQVAVTFKPETELKDLITWVMGFTCRNFIMDPRIVSTGKKVTVIAPNKMSAAEAYNLFLASLSTMGLTVVPKGNVMRIVDAGTAKSETIPIKTRGVPSNQDQMVRYVLRPTHTQTETLRAALDSIRSPSGSVTTAGNVILITDYSSQVRDMLTLAKTLDIPGNNEGIYTIPVKNSDAQALATKINEILGVSGGGGAAPQASRGGGKGGGAAAGGAQFMGDDGGGAVPSKILVDERTNTLIVVSSEAGYMRVKALVDRLDVLLDTEGGSAIRVYPLENALAEELAATLTTALSGQSQPNTRGAAAGQNVPPPQPRANPVGDLGSSLEGQVRVIGDKPTNSLIIMSSGRDYIAVRDVIRRLDQPRRQIFIEALILEVQLNKGLNLGSSSHGGLPVFGDSDANGIVLGGVQTPTLRSTNPASLATLTGLIGGLIGTPLENSQSFLGTSIPSYAILFQALATQDNSNILSAPHIIAIDNEKAEFSVGNNIPYKAGLTFGGFPTQGGGANPIGSIGQNIQREKLNLTLNVTPHISSNDSVRLEIEQETKDLGGSDPELGPTWAERKLKTQVVVHDQESVVIGGLIQEREVYGVTKVPLLGDIPLLGYLFKYSTKTKRKTNLLILLTPYIIKDQLDLASIKERKLREYREFAASFQYLNDKKYEARVDYRRKRGLLEEINRTLQSVEEDQALLDAAGQRRTVTEGAVDYAPSGIDAPDDGTPPPPVTAPPATTPIDAQPPAGQPSPPKPQRPMPKQGGANP